MHPILRASRPTVFGVARSCILEPTFFFFTNSISIAPHPCGSSNGALSRDNHDCRFFTGSKAPFDGRDACSSGEWIIIVQVVWCRGGTGGRADSVTMGHDRT